jgi:hypothetical protein
VVPVSLSALAGVDKKYKEEEAERKGKMNNMNKARFLRETG